MAFIARVGITTKYIHVVYGCTVFVYALFTLPVLLYTCTFYSVVIQVVPQLDNGPIDGGARLVLDRDEIEG
jgi:hypothetical protein